MLRIGITGGIGSGKSSVCEIFSYLGISVFHADLEARKLYDNNTELREKLIANFGKDIYNGDELIRPRLSEIVFSDSKKLQLLNGLIHPIIFDLYEAWCAKHSADIYTIKEAAIMFESGSYRHLHLVIGVIADDEIRIQRVMERDSSTREDVLRRMQNQMYQEELKSRCDFLIDNNGSAGLINQVMDLHRRFLHLAEAEPEPALRS